MSVRKIDRKFLKEAARSKKFRDEIGVSRSELVGI